MMTAQGIVFLSSKTKPLCTTALDGTFALTLLAFDRHDNNLVEPWRITWSGPEAKTFAHQNLSLLTPGQPLQVTARRLRAQSAGGRSMGPEIMVSATRIDLAPRATPKTTPGAAPTAPATQPATAPTAQAA